MPHFVLLFHDCPDDRPRASHWDLLFEEQGRLRAWALAKEPVPNIDLLGEQLPDHRLEYLSYEGPVSDNRGSVSRWDEGVYEFQEDCDNRIVARISGKRLVGNITLQRLDRPDQRWRVIWSRS